MFIIDSLLKIFHQVLVILSKKGTWIIIGIALIIGIIVFSFLRVNTYKKKIDKLNDEIEKLEIEKNLTKKELEVITNKVYVEKVFTNSDKVIEFITSEELSEDIKRALNEINKDYLEAYPK